MGLVRSIAALLFVIAVPLALITTNIRIAINEPHVYSYAIDHYDGVSTTGVPRNELLDAGAEMRAYFNRGGNGFIFVRAHQNGRSISLFNAKETEHLRDVKNLMQGMFRVQEVSVAFILAYVVGVFIWAREGTLRTLARQVLIASLVGIGVVAVAGVLAATGFDAAWERFHIIAFNNDLWALDPATDHLIQMFPEDFWRDICISIGLATLVEFVLLAAASGLYLLLTRDEPVTYAVTAGAHA